MSDYRFEMKDFELLAHPTEKTVERLGKMTYEFCQIIMHNEEQIIMHNLPNEAVLRLKKLVDSEIETRGLK